MDFLKRVTDFWMIVKHVYSTVNDGEISLVEKYSKIVRSESVFDPIDGLMCIVMFEK